MPVTDIKNLEGKKVGQIDLADDVFGAKVNQNLLHEAVRNYLAGKRAGTHKTKDKSEVSGSGKKLWKQKGTGRARIGSIRSPLWRHGGTVHGPVPRSYDYALPKKMIAGALRSALSSKLAENKLTVVDGWELDTHKTKSFRLALDKLEKDARSILLVGAGSNTNFDRASRNLQGVTVVLPHALQPYDLLRHEYLMLSREAAERLNRALSASHAEAAVQIQAASAGSSKPASKTEVNAKPAAKKSAKAPKAAKKPAAKKEKSKSKPKAKKD